MVESTSDRNSCIAGVARDAAQQRRGKLPSAWLRKSRFSRQHQRRVLLAGGEVVVPEERHLLDQRAVAADHPVDPPELVMAPLVGRVERALVDPRLRTVQSRAAGRPVDDPVERRAAAAAGPGARLGGGRAEAGAPEEAADVGLGPAGGGARASTPPTLRRAGARRRRAISGGLSA